MTLTKIPILQMIQTGTAATHDYSVGEYLTSDDFKAGLKRWSRCFEYWTIEGNAANAAEDFIDDFEMWKSGRLPAFANIYSAISKEYEPLENYDRYEDSTDDLQKNGGSGDTHSGKDTITHSGTDNITHEGTSKQQAGGTDTVRTTGTNTDTGSSQTGVFGYNSTDTAAPDTTSSATGSTNTDQTVTDTDTRSNTRTDNLADNTKYGHVIETDHGESIDTKYEETNKNTHTAHLHGNIGVTTSQEMLEAELKLRNTLFFKKFIIEDFNSYVLSLAEGVY